MSHSRAAARKAIGMKPGTWLDNRSATGIGAATSVRRMPPKRKGHKPNGFINAVNGIHQQGIPDQPGLMSRFDETVKKALLAYKGEDKARSLRNKQRKRAGAGS